MPPAAPLAPGWRMRFRGPNYAIAENDHALPRVWLPQRVNFRWREDVANVMRRATDFGAEGWIDEPVFKTLENEIGRAHV